MLQPAGVVVVLGLVHPVGEGRRHVDLHVVEGHVLPVLHLFLALPELHRGQAVLARQFPGVVQNAVFVAEVGGLKLAGGGLVLQVEGDPGVDHRLALQHVLVVFQAYIDIGKHLQVRLPLDEGAGALFGVGLLVQAAHVLPPLEVEGIALPVPADVHVHVLRGVLGGAEPQAVEAQGVLVALAGVVVILAAGVHLAEHQLPVVALLFGVVVHGDAPAVVLHLDGVVEKPGDSDLLAKALAGLVDGVGEDLEDGVLAAVDAVGAEDDRGPQPHPVRALQAGDAVVIVSLFFCHVPSCWRSQQFLL